MQGLSTRPTIFALRGNNTEGSSAGCHLHSLLDRSPPPSPQGPTRTLHIFLVQPKMGSYYLCVVCYFWTPIGLRVLVNRRGRGPKFFFGTSPLDPDLSHLPTVQPEMPLLRTYLPATICRDTQGSRAAV